MKYLLWPLQRLYFVYAFIIFLIVMLLIFPFVIIHSFFGRVKGGNMAYEFWNLWAELVFPLIFVFSSRKFETPHDVNRPYIFVATHTSYSDAAFVPKVIRQPLRILGKAEMATI